MAVFGHGPPNVLSNAGGVGKNLDSRRTSVYRMDDCCSANNNCDGPLCSSLLHISESLFISTIMDDHDEQKRTETEFNCMQL